MKRNCTPDLSMSGIRIWLIVHFHARRLVDGLRRHVV
jgi:hypothetical protein